MSDRDGVFMGQWSEETERTGVNATRVYAYALSAGGARRRNARRRRAMVGIGAALLVLLTASGVALSRTRSDKASDRASSEVAAGSTTVPDDGKATTPVARPREEPAAKGGSIGSGGSGTGGDAQPKTECPGAVLTAEFTAFVMLDKTTTTAEEATTTTVEATTTTTVDVTTTTTPTTVAPTTVPPTTVSRTTVPPTTPHTTVPNRPPVHTGGPGQHGNEPPPVMGSGGPTAPPLTEPLVPGFTDTGSDGDEFC